MMYGSEPAGKQQTMITTTMGARPPVSHLRQRFDDQLDALLQEILVMAASCAEMLDLSLQVLFTQDIHGVQAVLHKDDAVDALERQVENQAILVLALQQPVLATDLRFVQMTLKVVTDLERIGDHCVNIAKVGRKMAAEKVVYQPLVDVERLARLVAVMLDDISTALVKRDVGIAQGVIAADDEVDVLYQELQHQLRERMVSGEPGIVTRASYLLFVLHYLERIGDHCVGIAERLVYLVTGETKAPFPAERLIPS